MLTHTGGIRIAAKLEWYSIGVRERSGYNTDWFREWRCGYDVRGKQNKQ
jgi:hypothetical protein